jgi:hypothetical protein
MRFRNFEVLPLLEQSWARHPRLEKLHSTCRQTLSVHRSFHVVPRTRSLGVHKNQSVDPNGLVPETDINENPQKA